MSEKAERDKKAVTTLYAELNRFGQNGEHERAIKTANKSKNFNLKLTYGSLLMTFKYYSFKFGSSRVFGFLLQSCVSYRIV